MDIGLIVSMLVICGAVAAGIGHAKNLSAGSSFLYGLFLGVIGIAIVAVQQSGLPKAPAGLRAVRCHTCNAVQNIPGAANSFSCWQCKRESTATDSRQQGPEDAREWLDRVKKKRP